MDQLHCIHDFGMLNVLTGIFVDISSAKLKRRELADKYGITQMCVIPFEAGVLEFGRADDVVEWEKASSPPLLPKGEMRQGFESLGALRYVLG